MEGRGRREREKRRRVEVDVVLLLFFGGRKEEGFALNKRGEGVEGRRGRGREEGFIRGKEVEKGAGLVGREGKREGEPRRERGKFKHLNVRIPRISKKNKNK